MSVLMKALEKASGDRDKTPAMSPSAGRELALEALETKPVTSGYPPAPSDKDKARASAQRHAATVLSARQPTGASAIAWMRDHPLFVFGGLAGCFLLLYAAYVYVQIAHPGWLLRTPPRPPLVAMTPTPPAAGTGAAARAAPDAPAATTLGENAPQVPLPSVFASAQVAPPPAMPDDAAARVGSDISSGLTPRAVASPPPATAAANAAAPPARTAPGRDRIAVRRGDRAVPRVNPAVRQAYAALETGRFESAQHLYQQALRSEPKNIDALLGLAAIAQRDNRLEDAQRHFMAILEAEPRHALAQSGLIALMRGADPQSAELRLQQLLAREPSPPLYFNLGNLYADQNRWPQAQQAYFQAHNLEPENPDYTYNLAVALEHLGQQKLALGFYRKALQLASAKGAANFDTARIQDRVTHLGTRFE